MKPGILLFLWILLLMQPLHSQFSTDFSEGNLDVWQGDQANFILNGSQQLQLNAPSGSTSSWLYTPVNYLDSMVWEVYLRLNFAPSTSNQLKLYLGVNSSDLSTASGYYLEIGATGDQDPLELKYLNIGAGESIAASAPGLVGSDPVELTLRIIRNSHGDWSCYSIGGPLPELLFSATHTLLPLTDLAIFGFGCKYTETRRDKFIFDNIFIQPLEPDLTAPQCVSLALNDANSVTILFDEQLDANSINIPGNYILQPGNTMPDEIVFNQPNIVLRWNGAFVSQQEYTLAITGVKDLSGNVMIPDEKTFTYIDIGAAQPFDILITEIMADPSPVVGLPNAEYLEIFNNTNTVFRLSDYILGIGSSEISLPDQLISSGQYIIFCDADEVPLFDGFGTTIGLANFPGLTNTGATVSLKDLQNNILHEVSYTTSWYRDTDKANGGWSLEMINPYHYCSAMSNWTAPENLQGGTPGSVNSTWETTADVEGPAFISLYTSSETLLILNFDESLDEVLMENPSAYQIVPAIPIVMASVQNNMTVELTLSSPLQTGIVYQLLPFDTYDCQGNLTLLKDTIDFGLAVNPLPGDVLVNEILFNPASGGSRFVEIINVSENFINLNSLAIGRISATHNDIYATSINEILAPGQLAAFSPEPSDIEFRYTVPQPALLFDAQVPSWDDKSDNVSIISGGVIIDSFTYSYTWHLPVIADQNGVSLERVSTNAPSTTSSTWHSAASTVGYGTPTGANSQVLESGEDQEEPFTVINSVFSPDDDGFKDFLALNFLLTSGDDLGSVWIYDLEGREVINLLSNESLGSSTIVQWDGRNGDQVISDAGIYIIFVQLWDAAGNVREYQKTCALVKR